MTVSVPGSLTYSYAGNGATTAFSYPVKFLENADLVVVLEDDEGAQTVQTITTHYTVSGAGESGGGTVTMVTAPASGETLYIYRDTAKKQVVDLADSSRNPAQSVEDQLDRFAMAAQDLGAILARAVKSKVSVTPATFPEAEAEKVIGWNTAGDGLENKTIASFGDNIVEVKDEDDMASNSPTAVPSQQSVKAYADTLAAGKQDVISFATKTAAEAFNPGTAPDYIRTAGYAAAGDGGGALYKKVASEPSHDGKFQSADDTWWELAEDVVTPQMFGAFGDDGAATYSTQLTAMLDFVGAKGGGMVRWPKGNGYYLTDRLIPSANTTIVLEPGTEIHAINGGTRVFQIQAANIHIWGYGAQTVMDGTQDSHNIYITAGGSNVPENCSVRGLHAVGSGNTGDDCFYIGGDPANGVIPKNIQLIDCKGEGLGAGTRCGLAVVACDGFLIEGCEFWNALGAPGAGIDLEANLYMDDGTSALKRGVVRRNKVHDNVTGIAIVFADDVLIENNECYDNSADGIGSAAGGEQFTAGVYRTGDVLGVSAFDTTNGWITVTDANNLLTDDLGIEIGTHLTRLTRNSATWPTELTSTTRFVVNEISADQLSFRIGPQYDYGTVTSFAADGTGTKDLDPEASDFYFNVYREGNNSNIALIGNKVSGNGPANTGTQIKIAQGVNYHIERNNVLADGNGIAISYSQTVHAEKNTIRQVAGATAGNGLSFGTSSKLSTFRNDIYDVAGEGLSLSGCSRGSFSEDRVINCGTAANRPARFQLGSSVKISGTVVFNDLAHASTQGLILESTVSNSLVTGARCKGAGSTNANSIVNNGSGNRILDSIVNDGSFFGVFSTTYDAPSLADGAGVTTTISAPGTAVGDFALVSLTTNTSGITITGECYSGGVRIRLQNETGSTVDLASGTLRVQVFKQ